MIQLVSSRPLPTSLQGRGRLTDPDLLLTIAEAIRFGNSKDQRLVDDFGLVLADLRMAGTWKRTNRGRLICTEAMLCEHITPRPACQVSVLDLGASEGLTTLELASALQQRFGYRVNVTLADLNLWLYRYRKGPVFEYRAQDGEPIMVKFGPLGLRLARNRHNQPQSVDPLAKTYVRFSQFRKSMKLDTKISLVHPFVWNQPAVRVAELDCLVRNRSLEFSFDAVRASNILNPDYFARPQIDRALACIHAYLVEGGCLVVSRNRDDLPGQSEHGSVWRKTSSQFSHLADFGAGSEISSQVDRWNNA
jgi:SAM-dependent methyltransferase